MCPNNWIFNWYHVKFRQFVETGSKAINLLQLHTEQKAVFEINFLAGVEVGSKHTW